MVGSVIGESECKSFRLLSREESVRRGGSEQPFDYCGTASSTFAFILAGTRSMDWESIHADAAE